MSPLPLHMSRILVDQHQTELRASTRRRPRRAGRLRLWSRQVRRS